MGRSRVLSKNQKQFEIHFPQACIGCGEKEISKYDHIQKIEGVHGEQRGFGVKNLINVNYISDIYICQDCKVRANQILKKNAQKRFLVALAFIVPMFLPTLLGITLDIGIMIGIALISLMFVAINFWAMILDLTIKLHKHYYFPFINPKTGELAVKFKSADYMQAFNIANPDIATGHKLPTQSWSWDKRTEGTLKS